MRRWQAPLRCSAFVRWDFCMILSHHTASPWHTSILSQPRALPTRRNITVPHRHLIPQHAWLTAPLYHATVYHTNVQSHHPTVLFQITLHHHYTTLPSFDPPTTEPYNHFIVPLPSHHRTVPSFNRTTSIAPVNRTETRHGTRPTFHASLKKKMLRLPWQIINYFHVVSIFVL